VFRRTLTPLIAAAAVAFPAFSTVAAAAQVQAIAKKKVVRVSKSVNGSVAGADRWGDVEVNVSYTKTTTTVNGKKHVTVKVTKVAAPVYPNHTDRSSYISSQALPLLEQEVVQLQPASNLKTFQLVSGATDTSYAFAQSLQAALLAIGK
jgi:uncharacterized protein with FMN-binding domain